MQCTAFFWPFRAAEYIACGFSRSSTWMSGVHNSLVVHADHKGKKVTFKYKSRANRKTGEKKYPTKTMDVSTTGWVPSGVMVPDKHRKTIRYYGIYASGIKDRKSASCCPWFNKNKDAGREKEKEVCVASTTMALIEESWYVSLS